MAASSRLCFVLSAIVAGMPAPAHAHAQGQPAPGPASRAPIDPARMPSRPDPTGTVAAPGAPARDTSAHRVAATGTAVIRGRVIALDTGLPLRRASVSLFGEGQPRRAITDGEGAFSLEQLPAGRYQLRASKVGYVDTPHAARRPGGPGRPLTLADGQSVEGVVLALPPGGVIAGRVVDDAGEPVAGARVVPMRFRTINGERQLTAAGALRMTDDTGTFRLYGLAPGTYYLSAAADELQRFGGDVVEPEPTGFAPTFYPGTPVAAEAQPIEVVAGADVVADVQLVLARLTTVTGVVVSPAGAPATGGFVMARTHGFRGGGMSGGPGNMIKPDGTFRLQGLAPGEYSLVAQPSFGEPSMFEGFPPRQPQRTATADIVATGDPITGLRLVVQDPIRIPVTVSFEDGDAERPDRVFVTADTERGPGGARATLQDGRLSLEVVPGTYRLYAGVMSAGPAAPGARWFTRRIIYRGEDVEGEEVELTAEPGGRIDVVLTTRSSTLTGGVTDGSGTPVTDCRVILVPEDGGRRNASRYLRFVDADEQGRFRVEHLRPGRYLATAVAGDPIEDVYDADFLDAIRRAGTVVTVAEGAAATLALTLTALP